MGTGLFRVKTRVRVIRSIDAILRVQETFPCLSVNNESDAALAAAPSLTPSARREMTFLTTSPDTVFAPRPEVCPSARTTDKPPLGLSITSSVSPLSDTAYLLVLATAIWTSMNQFYNKSSLQLLTFSDVRHD